MPPLKQELDEKILALEKGLDGARSAISRLAQQYNTSLEQVSNLTAEIATLKMQVEALQKRGGPIHDNSITRYE